MEKYEREKAVTSIQRSMTLLALDEDDKKVLEFICNNNWGPVRDLITERGPNLSLKLVCCICSVGPPQSVIIAIKRANSRIYSQVDEKGRHPLHYLCYYGAPTFAIVYAAQCYIAALEHNDNSSKNPLEYLTTMKWDYYPEDKQSVILELQKCHTLKCYDTKSELPNQIALERWGYKIVVEEKIKCFMVCHIECARFEQVEDWDGCGLSHIAEQIRDGCNDVGDDLIRKNGKNIHINPYRLVENKFAIIVKTQSQEDCEIVYKALCLKHLGSLKHEGTFLRIGCVYSNEVVGSFTLKELLKEAEELQNKVKENIESGALAISMSMADVSGDSKINVSPFTSSTLNDFVKKEFIPDDVVRSRK